MSAHQQISQILKYIMYRSKTSKTMPCDRPV